MPEMLLIIEFASGTEHEQNQRKYVFRVISAAIGEVHIRHALYTGFKLKESLPLEAIDGFSDDSPIESSSLQVASNVAYMTFKNVR